MIPIPTPDNQTSLRALRMMFRERHPLAALQVFHEELGDVFRITLPGFKPVMLVGPEAARFLLSEEREKLLWRVESDPVTRLLRHGVLVEDGKAHDQLRSAIDPALHHSMLESYVEEMWRATHEVASDWPSMGVVDMLVEMRKVTLKILVATLFRADISPHLSRLWGAVLGTIRYISPGVWMFWPGFPRPHYRAAIRRLDNYLHQLIVVRRDELQTDEESPSDLLGSLILAGMPAELIRDQLLTLLIAGHDTSTAMLAWTFYLLGQHPDIYARAREEVHAVLGDKPPSAEGIGSLAYLGQVLRESLRLYPPIHLGSRQAATDLEYQGYTIPVGTRVMYSIYLTQRHPSYWEEPHRFRPDRFAAGRRPAAYSWLALGGGPRNCVGGAFGVLEGKVVLAYVLRHFTLQLAEDSVRPHMGATLEPRPGVFMRLGRENGFPGAPD